MSFIGPLDINNPPHIPHRPPRYMRRETTMTPHIPYSPPPKYKGVPHPLLASKIQQRGAPRLWGPPHPLQTDPQL